MLTPRAARPRRAVRRRLCRALPALALAVTTLALTLPASPPASAGPRSPGTGSTSSTDPGATGGTRGGTHLTAEAKAAGLQVGDATMGWRERGTERGRLQQGSGLRPGSASRSTSSSFTPGGVLGVDVSSYQRAIRWSTMTAQGKRFVYVKATEGTTYQSRYFRSQYRGAAAAGMIRGAYHFANPAGRWGSVQARYFVKHGGGWSADGRTLPGVLDIEYNPYGATCYGLSRREMVRWITSFTNEYKKLTGRAAVIYTTTDWWRQCTGSSGRFSGRNPLWIARYGTTTPGTLPRGWSTATFWQYSSIPIDQDVFPGGSKALRTFATRR